MRTDFSCMHRNACTWAATALIAAAASWPCAAGIAVDRLSLEATSGPGNAYSGTIVVRNTGSDPATTEIYQADYLFWSDGSNAYGEPGGDERSNAGWITFVPRTAEMPPNGSVSIEYWVAVPADSSLVGTYWSLLMVEERDPPRPVGSAGEMEAGVTQVLRYAIQIVTDIGDTGSRAVRLVDKMLTLTADGHRTFHVDVENTGERRLRPFVWIELYDADGTRLGPYQSERKRIYPGTSARYSVDLSDVPSGSYQAFVVVDNGDEHAFGAQYGLEF